MFRSYCKRLLKDFDFVKEFGYFFWSKNEDKTSHSIIYRNKKEALEIGYSFKTKAIYANHYIPADSNSPQALRNPKEYDPDVDVLDRQRADITSNSLPYRLQIFRARDAVYSFLINQVINQKNQNT